MERSIGVIGLRPSIESAKAVGQGGGGECERDDLAHRGRRSPVDHVSVESEPARLRAGPDKEETILVVLVEGGTEGGTNIGGGVVLLQRRRAERETGPDEEAGAKQRHEDRAIGVDRAVRRPDDGLLPSPLRCHGRYSFAAL